MKLKDLETLFHNDLDILYGKEEVSSFFVLLIEHYYSISRIQLALDPSISISKEEQDVFFEALNALKEEKPIQYILGETEFYGLPFKVNENTLIPRPETEELVALVLQNVKNQNLNSKAITILDIGTGSGCIAIALAKNLPNAKVFALDVSVEALKIAKENAKLNAVNVFFIKEDILNTMNGNSSFLFGKETSEEQKKIFDIIVSNPPYVRNLEKAEMKPNVLNSEPHSALFVDDNNPLVFYKAICEFSKSYLKQNGSLFFEINEYLGKETLKLVKDHNFINVELKKDFFDKDRMIKGHI